MKLIRNLLLIVIALLNFSFIAGVSGQATPNWEDILKNQLQLHGHRNWILVVDAAYPYQSNPAIKTIVTGADHLSVVKEVLAAVDKASHVAPQIYLDTELNFVPDEEAPGIEEYRTKLKNMLGEKTVKEMPHEEIIYMLDEAAETFGVLVLKTNFTIPYTSVFINLDCGYWNTEQENKLRKLMPDEN